MSNDVLPNNKLITPAQLAELHDGAWQWAMSIVGADRASAEDVLQQVYLKIVEGRARYDGRSALKTWLYSVIRNTGASYARRRIKDQMKIANFSAEQKANGSSFDERSSEGSGEGSSEGPGIGAGEDAVVDDASRKQLVAQALFQLPTRQRDVLELTVYREFTLEQCASILGIRVGTVRTHYHRGKATLRQLLGSVE